MAKQQRLFDDNGRATWRWILYFVALDDLLIKVGISSRSSSARSAAYRTSHYSVRVIGVMPAGATKRLAERTETRILEELSAFWVRPRTAARHAGDELLHDVSACRRQIEAIISREKRGGDPRATVEAVREAEIVTSSDGRQWYRFRSPYQAEHLHKWWFVQVVTRD